MAKYRKKPVVIDAMRWAGVNPSMIMGFCPNAVYHSEAKAFVIETLEGRMRVTLGDWVIKGVEGEFYPCKPNIFEATYEPVDV